MRTDRDLETTLRRIDGRGYKAYKDLRGVYDFRDYTLYIDYVQGDPFASPSRIRVRVPQSVAEFPKDTYEGKSREVALRDYLTRAFYGACRRFGGEGRGTGKSGMMAIDRPGQEVLERTSAFVNDEWVEARFVMGLPAFGRRIAGRQAEHMFFEVLPRIVVAALYHESLDPDALMEHVKAAEDADFLRSTLDGMGLVAFVADGAILPRASGIDPRPLTAVGGRVDTPSEGAKQRVGGLDPAEGVGGSGGRLGRVGAETRGAGAHKGGGNTTVIPFQSPSSFSTTIDLPNKGPTTGMGIPKGVTLVVGGGYHGKSTLLNALELGIYNHIPGDGRELVVTDPGAMKIRAEDGRRIERVDISPFITNLPFGKDTTAFSSEDASGSTSQAANIMESLEVGASTLLIDEDTSATNFMIRDHRMQELVAKDREPITPFIDKVRQLYDEMGISTVLVIGGSGDYFDVADRVICMVEYVPRDVSDEAKAVVEKYRAERNREGGDTFGEFNPRVPLAGSFDPSRGKRDVKISSRGLHTIAFGTHNIDLGEVEQLVDGSQTRAIGDTILYATKYMDGTRTMREIVDAVIGDIEGGGLDVLSSRMEGEYAVFRGLELAAAVNRLRTLRVGK